MEEISSNQSYVLFGCGVSLTVGQMLTFKEIITQGVGGQKKPKLVNVVCERPLTVNYKLKLFS